MPRPVLHLPSTSASPYRLQPTWVGPIDLRHRNGTAPTPTTWADPGAADPTHDSPWLCWLTGSLALVSLAAMDGDPLGAPPRRRVVGSGTSAGLARLADAAPALGWSVFARLQPRPARQPCEAGVTWLVLGTHPETTTVIQRDAHAEIVLPLTVQLHPRSDGRCEARVHDARQFGQHGLPEELLTQVAALSDLIDRAWR